jgi:hypothetical protein
MKYQYGFDEVDELNWKRLLSARPKNDHLVQEFHGTFYFRPPRNSIVLIDSFYIELNAKLVVGNRRVAVTCSDVNGYYLWAVVSGFLHPAATNVNYSFSRGCDTSLLLGDWASVCLPGVILSEGQQFFSVIDNLDSTDDVTGGILQYRILELNNV